LGLRIFKDSDPVTLWEFAEHYKAEIKKREDRDKRYRVSQLEKMEALKKLYEELIVDYDEVKRIKKKYKEAKAKWLTKVKLDAPVEFKGFVPVGKIATELRQIFEGDVEKAAEKYYGFGWTHELLSCEKYEGRTFDRLKEAIEKTNTGEGCVEIRVVEKPKSVKSRKGNIYYTVKVEDADWHEEVIRVWDADYARFKEELNAWDERKDKGNLLRIRLKAPDYGFKNYSFASPPRDKRHEVPADKRDDYRLTVLPRPCDQLDELRKL
jgi:hypothetical protein